MGSTWQSLEDNEDLFLGRRSLKSDSFFLRMSFRHVFHQTQGLSLSPSSTNRLILPPSNFLTEAPGQYTGGMQMQGQGQMMQVSKHHDTSDDADYAYANAKAYAGQGTCDVGVKEIQDCCSFHVLR